MNDKDVSENMDRLIGRLFRARWITGTNITRPEGTRLTLTELGTQRFATLETSLLEQASGGLLFNRQQAAAVWICWLPIIAELQPPPFTESEIDTFTGYVAGRLIERGKLSGPPEDWH